MTRRAVRVLLVATLVALATACGSNGSTASSTSAPSAGGSTVTIADFSFTSASLRVKAGATVTFRNTGMQAHTATSDTSGGFDAGTLQPGDTKDVTLSTPGTITYHCSFHPTMKATIVVS